MFVSYPKLNKVRPSSWVAWSPEAKTVRVWLQAACHMSLNFDSPGLSNLVTAVPNSDEVSLAYQRMLINGPFKAFSDLITLNRSGDFYYIYCSHLDKWPANVLYNYCIATRVPIEHKYLLPLWSSLVEEGYDSTLAFLLSYSYRGEKKQVNREWPVLGHFWFDPSASWRRVLNGDMQARSESYYDKPTACTPTNKIWGVSRKYLEFSKLSNKEISAHFELEIEPVKVLESPISALKLHKPDGMPYELWKKILADNVWGDNVHDAAAALVPAPNWQINPAIAAWNAPQHEGPINVQIDEEPQFDNDF